jgi:hypothetical protein
MTKSDFFATLGWLVLFTLPAIAAAIKGCFRS